jgi:uncharacterized protein
VPLSRSRPEFFIDSAGRNRGTAEATCNHWRVSETATNRCPTLEELRARRNEIMEIAARYGVYNIRIFGSVARGNAAEASDVDFLVDIEKGRSLFDLGGFYADLQDLLGCEIDVGTQIKPRLRAQVEAEAVAL